MTEASPPFRVTKPMPPRASVDLAALCCPYPDHGRLRRIAGDQIECESCARRFRSVDGRPVLFDEGRSIFSPEEVASTADARQFQENSGWLFQIRRMMPAARSRELGVALLEKYRDALPDDPAVLIIGCGYGTDQYVKLFKAGRIFTTDVTLRGAAAVACDGACLPFRDQTLDCVVVDQVLEHALDPLAVVGEIYRCLKPGGVVYSGVPFHTPVHGFPFDFQRYTPLGHRMLFRRFEELEVHITQGPVSALSKTVIGFFGSMSGNLWWRRLSSAGVRLLARPMLWLDSRYASARELSIPAASAFLGRKHAVEESAMSQISRWGTVHQRRAGEARGGRKDG